LRQDGQVAFGLADQPLEVGVIGKRLADRRQHLGDEDVPVAGVAELIGQRAPARVEVADVFFRQQRPPETDRRAQAAHGDARLVDVFGRIGLAHAALVALQLRQTREGGAAEDPDAGHPRCQRHVAAFTGASAAGRASR
jgi:hypothetical protein